MKKILTLVFALGTISSVFAQYGRKDESRDIMPGQNKTIFSDDRRFVFSARERDEQIRQINWRFDNAIADVAHDRFLRGGERRRQIRMLDAQRAEQIRLVNLRFAQRAPYDGRGYDGHGYNDDRGYRDRRY